LDKSEGCKNIVLKLLQKKGETKDLTTQKTAIGESHHCTPEVPAADLGPPHQTHMHFSVSIKSKLQEYIGVKTLPMLHLYFLPRPSPPFCKRANAASGRQMG
jgi:hypothetical protein